ncbi:hypothetical protein PM082_004408 [Marasmius tenuissimus]|nr:hypothetical protein PM082_004408 [Marasmius tenuissimus]
MSVSTVATTLSQTLTTSLWNQKIVTYFHVVSSTILVYDVLLNLDLEINLIWRRKWSLVEVVYLLQRYFPFFDITGVILYRNFQEGMSLQDCVSSFRIVGWSLTIGIVLSEVLLAIRLWAVWERKISVAIGIFVFFLGCWIPCFILFNTFANATKFASSPVPQSRGCFISGGSHILYLCWILVMVYDTGNVIMIAIPGISAFRMGGKSELVNAVYRDGIVYYILTFLVSLVNVIVILTVPRNLTDILSSFERVLHSVLASRAILQIRRVALLEPTISTINTTTELAAQQSR